jgi:hypothetical protein
VKRTDENKKHGREHPHSQIQGHRNKDNDRDILLRSIGTPASAVNYDRTHRDGATRGEQQDHTRGQPRKQEKRTEGTELEEETTQPRGTFIASRIYSYMRAKPSPGYGGVPVGVHKRN